MRQKEAWACFAAAACLFATEAPTFAPRVTDVSAMRMVLGDVPYRDFWTMYAPGSFSVLAVVFAVFGPQMIVSNLLGNLAAAAGVAICFLLARRLAPRWLAVAAAAIVASAFYGTDYSNGLTSFPSAFVLVMLGMFLTLRRIEAPAGRAFGWPGFAFGTAMVFKHDVAAYALVAAAVALVRVRWRAGLTVVGPVVSLAFGATVLPVTVVVALVSLGAGPEMWRDLVIFPLTDFPYVRPEYFPLVPRIRESFVVTVQDFVRWGSVTFPTIALAAGIVVGWRSRHPRDLPSSFLLAAAVVAFALHWMAAHVQLNTHLISMAVWGALVAVGGLAATTAVRRPSWAACALVAVWAAMYPARTIYDIAVRWHEPRVWVGLPRLSGIRAPEAEARWMRDLAAGLTRAGDPSAPLLFVSNRNDVHVFAALGPFWLTDRRSASRFHELHPGITDTLEGQQRLIEDLGVSPAPVVVREHRFSDSALDEAKAAFGRHVPVGAPLVDAWIADRYEAGRRFGSYELLDPR